MLLLLFAVSKSIWREYFNLPNDWFWCIKMFASLFLFYFVFEQSFRIHTFWSVEFWQMILLLLQTICCGNKQYNLFWNLNCFESSSQSTYTQNTTCGSVKCKYCFAMLITHSKRRAVCFMHSNYICSLNKCTN